MKRSTGPQEMAVFVCVVERRSFSAAGRELGLTPSAVSKMVSRMEKRLRFRLIERNTRGLAVTPDGEAFFTHCRRFLADLAAAEEAFSRRAHVPAGLVRVHCGVAFGEEALMPLLGEFLRRYPEVQLDVTQSDDFADLRREGIDIAIRIGGDAQPELIARRLCHVERILCAAPSYLRRAGRPESPAALAKHNCLYISGNIAHRRWPFRSSRGPELVEVSGSFRANSGRAVLQLALQGVGIARLIDVIVASPIRRGSLVPLLSDWHQGEAIPLVCLSPEPRRRLPRVSALLDFLEEKLSSAPWRTAQMSRRR